MSIDFNADEVFEVAEQIERNGAEFYRNVADKVKEQNKKNLLLDLARMEDEHEKIFKSLRAQLSYDEKIQTTFDPNGESEGYLHALANTRIFYEKKIDTSSYEEILKSAITVEKDSIVFYLGMKEVVPTEVEKQRIDDIIKEEMSHIKLLSKELMELKNNF
jgi:rubrerythrin